MLKKVVVGFVAAGVFLAGAGTAFASSWQKLSLKPVDRAAAFEKGRYRFNPAGQNHGSFEWSGRLVDAAPRDGHNVFVAVRVEGHPPVRYYGKQGKAVDLHHYNWDGAQRYTDDAYITLCVDRGSIRGELCSAQLHLTSPQKD